MTRKHGVLAAQAVVTIALLWLLFRAFDWQAFAAVMGRVSAGFVIGGFAAVLLGHLLYAWRWQTVLNAMGMRLPYVEVLQQYLMGIFFGNLMPTAVGGDAAKVYYLGRKVGYIGVGASVFVDRFLGFLWLSVLGASLAWRVGAASPLLVLNRNLLTMTALIFVSTLITVWIVPADRLIPALLRRGRFAAVAAKLEQFAHHVRDGGCRVSTLLVSGTVVTLSVTLITVMYQQYFSATGATVPALAPTMNAVISMSVFINIPLSVNGIGLREQLHYLLFDSMGLPKEVSVSLSLLVFSYLMVLSFIGYLVWMRLPAPAQVEPA
jgi:glycosyltransferase 2 family protein